MYQQLTVPSTLPSSTKPMVLGLSRRIYLILGCYHFRWCALPVNTSLTRCSIVIRIFKHIIVKSVLILLPCLEGKGIARLPSGNTFHKYIFDGIDIDPRIVIGIYYHGCRHKSAPTLKSTGLQLSSLILPSFLTHGIEASMLVVLPKGDAPSRKYNRDLQFVAFRQKVKFEGS